MIFREVEHPWVLVSAGTPRNNPPLILKDNVSFGGVKILPGFLTAQWSVPLTHVFFKGQLYNITATYIISVLIQSKTKRLPIKTRIAS